MAPPSPLAESANWPAPAAAGVTDAKRTRATAGDAGREGRWASVTKLITALAVLVAAEEGTVDLDEPAGPPGASVRHLLAHTSGLPFDGTTPMAPPGRQRIYSNAGFDLVGDLLTRRAGMPFARYLREAVLDPLGMRATVCTGSPASGATGPLADLLTLGRELLAPRLVAPKTLQAATAVAFPGLAGVLPGYGRQDPNDWGLGFELRDAKSPHWTGSTNSPATFGHYGRAGSFLWVDPEARLACAGLAGADAGAWSAKSWPRLADAVLTTFVPPERPGTAEPVG